MYHVNKIPESRKKNVILLRNSSDKIFMKFNDKIIQFLLERNNIFSKKIREDIRFLSVWTKILMPIKTEEQNSIKTNFR